MRRNQPRMTRRRPGHPMGCCTGFRSPATRLQTEALEARWALATFAVTPDVPDGEPGSLRAAIIASNQNGEDDVIQLAAGVYQLTLRDDNERGPNPHDASGGDLDLTDLASQVVIRGAQADTTIIDATELQDRVFDIAAGVDAVFEGVTIQGGSHVSAGGGINVATDVSPFDAPEPSFGSLVVRHSILRNNHSTYEGGGINNWGPMTIENSRFVENTADYEGGGIEHNGRGDATIIASTFTGNRSNYEGAGISVGTWTVGRTTMTILDSTIDHNRARYTGGGIDGEAATVSITNSTLSHNDAGSGGGSINNWRGKFDVDHVTVWNGTAGSSGVQGRVTASNSIFIGHGFADIGEGFTSAGQNLVGRVGDARIRQADSVIVAAEAKLGPLADNGGPTLTHAPRQDSPVIDAAIDSQLSLDQRQQPRPNDGDGDGIARNDLGSVEAAAVTIYHVNSERDAIDLTPGDGLVDTGVAGEVTLRAAVMEAAALESPARIVLPAGSFELTLGRRDNRNPDEDFSRENDLDLYGQMMISGAGSRQSIVSAGGRHGVFEVHESAHVVMADMGVRHGAWDGGVVNHGSLELNNALIDQNRSNAGQGGAVTNFAELAVKDSVIAQNNSGSSGFGGGLANYGNASVTRSTFDENESGDAGMGGAIANRGNLVLMESTLSNNSSGPGSQGGAIYTEDGRLQMINSTLSSNRTGARGEGGAILVNSGVASIVSATIVRNAASVPGAGGGIAIREGADVRIANTIVSLNERDQIIGDYSDEGFNFVAGDPKLTPLEDHGGPTQVHLPLSGSPVIDQGNAFQLETDQRGQPRTFDDPRVNNLVNREFPVFDDFGGPVDGDATDIGAAESRYELITPETQNDFFHAFGAFYSNDLANQPNSVLDNDLWLTPLAAVLVDAPQHGLLQLSDDGSFLYVPNNGFLGQDEFSYMAQAAANTSEVTTAIVEIIAPASISGRSYIDRDDDGVIDGSDTPLSGTTVHLDGIDRWGNTVQQVSVTNSDGLYQFDDLAPGTYTVRNEELAFLVAGQLTLGDAGGEINGGQFRIELSAGTRATSYNFAELLPPEIPAEPQELEGGNPAGRIVGDVNLDGRFDSRDLVLVFQTGHYDDGRSGNSNFEHGDWNDDHEFDSKDLVFAFQIGHYALD